MMSAPSPQWELRMHSLEDQVLIALRKIIRATDLESRRLEKKSGLTTPQLVVLRAIQARQLPMASQVARDVSLSQATVTTILNRLEQNGLVTRQRSDKDKRQVFLALTNAGETLCQNAPRPLQENLLTQFNALKDWEQYQLLASLERIAAMMDASDLDAAPMLSTEQRIA